MKDKWYAPLAQAQYAETRAADSAARYAARANRANAPPQLNNLAQGIELENVHVGMGYTLPVLQGGYAHCRSLAR